VTGEFRGKKALVMGLGLFGGGVGVTRFLVAQGADVTVTDLKDEAKLADAVEKINDLPVSLHLGGHREDDFARADVVIVNPAVPKDSPYLAIAEEHGARLDTEMNIFFRLCPAPIIGVTGSNGKSTTTALVYEMLKRGRRRVWLGGNIGQSLVCNVDEMSESDLVVLELSSFQLEDLARIRCSPHVAAVLNLCPNHLDRHKTFENYAEAKRNIVRFQQRGDMAVLNADDENLRPWVRDMAADVFFFSRDPNAGAHASVAGDEIRLRLPHGEMRVSLASFKLPGFHNRLNAAAAALTAGLVGATTREMESALGEFNGLEHRIEFVRSLGGVEYYNDSIATTPESASAALEAFDAPIILIAGGYDKHIPLDAFARKAAERAKKIILIGDTARKLAGMIGAAGPPVVVADSLQAAVREAHASSRPGDIVLLSPACASYDMFTNFAERGRMFKEFVADIEDTH